MGRVSRSWDLLKQSLAVLMSDKELMWLPVLSGVFCAFATIIIGGVGLLMVVPLGVLPAGPAGQKLLAKEMAPYVFVLYIAIYSIATYFNVALVSIAGNRLAGGDAGFYDGLQAAWDRKWSIFQWALVAATVGMLLHALERRLSFLGRFIAGITGVVWTLASFFVVPLLAAENIGPVEALYKSAHIYKKTWGEQLAGSFSFSVIFFFLSLAGLVPIVMLAKYGAHAMLTGFVFLVIYWLLLAIVGSAARGVFLAALYRYATTGQVSGGFRLDDLSGHAGQRRFAADGWQRE